MHQIAQLIASIMALCALRVSVKFGKAGHPGVGGASIGSPSHPPTASAMGGDVAGLQRPGVPDCRCHLSLICTSGSQFSPFHTSQLDHTELFLGDLRFNLTGSERKKLLWKSP